MSFPIDSTVQLAIIESQEEAELLPSEYEPLVIGHEPLYLQDLIEDELLLALPIVPMHPKDQCPAGEQEYQADEPDEQEEAAKDNPFAALADLKLKR